MCLCYIMIDCVSSVAGKSLALRFESKGAGPMSKSHREQQELSRQTDAYSYNLSSGVTLAATVLLGFIFNSVRGPGANPVVVEGERITLERAWGTSILSILFGFMYIAASSVLSWNAGLALRCIADETEPLKPEVAKSLGRLRRSSSVFRAIRKAAILLQIAAFGAALLFLTRAMWTYQ